MAGGESRLGMRVMYMISLNHGLAQKSTTILHAYKLAENPRKPAQSRAFAHKDPRKFSLYDGRHRRVGVFAFFHAVGVVPLLSALARGRAQDLQLPDAVRHGENPDRQSHPLDARSRASPSFAGLFRRRGGGVARQRRSEGVPASGRAHVDRARRNRVFLLAKARLPTLPDA